MRARACVPAILVSITAALPVQAVQRTFVASYGNDANAANNCSFANPCRSFTAAHSVTDSNGEIVALDAAGYGAVTITKSVTITSNPGFYAGILASTGNGVTIATAGINVTLRGLNINGFGSSLTNGVSITNGARLSVENCVISNFSDGVGIFVNANAAVRVIDSVFRDNEDGLVLDGGVAASVSGSKFLGNSNRAIHVGAAAATVNILSVADSQVSGSFVAIEGHAGASGSDVRVAVMRTSMTNGSYGPVVQADAGATAVVTVSSSLISGNTLGSFSQLGAGSSTLESLGNNTIRQNGPPDGTITIVPQS